MSVPVWLNVRDPLLFQDYTERSAHSTDAAPYCQFLVALSGCTNICHISGCKHIVCVCLCACVYVHSEDKYSNLTCKGFFCKCHFSEGILAGPQHFKSLLLRVKAVAKVRAQIRVRHV